MVDRRAVAGRPPRRESAPPSAILPDRPGRLRGRVLGPRLRASLAYFAFFGGLGAFLPYASLYYLGRGLDYPQIGALLSLSALVGLVAGPMWGALSDRVGGAAWVLLASGGVAVAGVGVLRLAGDFGPILVANLLIGAGTTGILPILDARALESSGVERAGWGPLRAWGSAGWVASSFLTGLAIEAWGLGIIFVVAGTGFVAAAILASGLAPVVRAPAERPLRAAFGVFRTWMLGLFLLGMLFASASMAAGLDFITPRFNELGAAAGTIGLSWAIAAAVEVPVMFAFPALARRFGGTRLLVLGAIVLAARTGITGGASDPGVLVAASGLGGVGYALYTVGGVTYVARQVPPQLAATGQGIFQGVVTGLSGVIAAAVGGIVAGSLSLAGMFVLAAGVGLGAAAVVALAVLWRAPTGARL